MLYIGAVFLLLMVLCIVLALKGTAVKVTDDEVAIGFHRYSVAAHTFRAEKIPLRPLRRPLRIRWVVRVAVLADKQPVRTHHITMADEAAADALLATIAQGCMR